MAILSDEYDTAMREIRSLRLQLRANKESIADLRAEAAQLADELSRATTELGCVHRDFRLLCAERDAWREKAEKAQHDADLLSEDLDGAKAELQALRDSSWLVQERDAARAEAEALQEALGRVRADRDQLFGGLDDGPPNSILRNAPCPVCGKRFYVTANGRLHRHGTWGDPCSGSGAEVSP